MLPALVVGLLKAGLPLLANAALAKGKEYVEEKTGIKLEEEKPLTPEQEVALKMAEETNKVELEKVKLENNKLDAALEQAYLVDVQSARTRDMKMIEAGYRNSRANTMLAGAGGLVLVILAVAVWMSPLDEYVKGILTLILGRCLGYIDQGFNFEFGTTRQSKSKDETISDLAKR